MGILHQLHENVRLRIVRVESFVFGGIVVLQQDHGVLPLAHVHVVFVEVPVLFRGLPHQVDGVAVGLDVGRSVDMDGNKQVRTRFVGLFGTVVERDETVAVAGHEDLHVRVGFPDPGGEAFGNLEGDVLFPRLAVLADRSGILAAMAGVDDHGGQAEPGVRCPGGPEIEAGQQGYSYADCAFQYFVVLL